MFKEVDAAEIVARNEIAKKTEDAIATERPPPIANREAIINGNLPPLPRYPPPAPDGRRRACRMFFPSSGHMGFDTLKVSEELPPLEILREMILYETRLRLSDSIQDLMDLYHEDEAAVTFVHDLIQQHVVEYFGYQHVNALRTALYRFPDDPVVQAAFYVKHNRITQGLINQGQYAQDVNLYNLDGQPTNLFSQISVGQPLVVLTGSST
ncbi:unnamed protein product [Rotaria sordida]|uniref:Uncharacterized protein n=1 Tax=Rotaria sordida TaxID=392033 RepID=A0A815RKQ2_9BILA|nr:unnamed protein product [Rotaria sordida]